MTANLNHERSDPTVFYDGLAADYHLVFPDWEESVERHGRVLHDLIRARLQIPSAHVLDCTCGIGTQAIGLARYGHVVVGTDLSSLAIERARREAAKAGVEIEFAVHDVRSLGDLPGGPFDVVMSCDNSLPHLMTEADLRSGVHGMVGKIRRGGMLIATIRDYDTLVRERPRATLPTVTGEDSARRMVFQVWSWAPDGRTYAFDHVIGTEVDGEWSFTVRRGEYRAVLRDELSTMLTDAGLTSVQWLQPEQSGFFFSLSFWASRSEGREIVFFHQGFDMRRMRRCRPESAAVPRVAALLLFGVLFSYGCEDSTGPEPANRADVTRSYTAETLTTTTGNAIVDQLAAGTTIQLTLHENGTTSGRLFVPNGGEDGGDFDADLLGTFTFDEAASQVSLDHTADTFLRDLVLEATRSDGVVRLEGRETFGNTTVQVRLRGS